eukprot:Gb_29676 [translate_table: standard]
MAAQTYNPSSNGNGLHRKRRPDYTANRIDDPSYIRILDTTLRDGEQSPGAAMTVDQKLDVARQLAKLGVDVIEAGFPAASPGDVEAVKLIAKEVGNCVDEDGYVPLICASARCNKTDIDAAWQAVRYAMRPRITTFIATSDIHLTHKLRKSREEVVNLAREMVTYARSIGCPDVEFCAEDAARSDREFLYHILEEVIKAGASTLDIPDTVGYTLPTEYGKLIADIKANTKGIENAIISTHCHNDLGLATANTLAGAYGGARQLEVTVNGIGERAGNASLEEVVMAIICREEKLGGLHTGINTKQISRASQMVSNYTGMLVQPHKAIVGANAFAHESGIHQDGMLKFKGTYEILSPEDIGLVREDESGIVLGKLSGRHALRSKLLKLGYELNGQELADVFQRFKVVAEKKKTLSDEDLEALISDEVSQPQIIWSLVGLQVACGTLGLSTGTVKLTGPDGEEHIACAVGTGPVDAAYKAVDSIVKIPVTLLDYSLSAVTKGIDAIASTKVLLREQQGHSLNGETTQRTFSGTGAGTDIVVSSVQAYINALNKISGFRGGSMGEISSKVTNVSA